MRLAQGTMVSITFAFVNHWLTFFTQGNASLAESAWPVTSDIFSWLEFF
jgi:hypothetical protein